MIAHADKRVLKEWLVLKSPENDQANRCCDIFRRPDGSFGFEELRRDPEDQGSWTPMGFHSGKRFATQAEAKAAALKAVPWLRELASPTGR